MPYGPTPIDTSRIDLTPGIRALSEALAKNNHEVWARARLAEGWTWGPQRDDAAARHPNLVPFEELSEAEKDYDRRAGDETIKAILSFGYTILPPAVDGDGRVIPEADVAPDAVVSADLGVVLERWRTRDRAAWERRPDLYPALAGVLRRAGEPLVAYDVATEGLALRPADVRLRQMVGLVLADLGCHDEARAILEPLARERHASRGALEETVGILARLYKELALAARDIATRRRWLARAYRTYSDAYRRTGGHWTGINAATCALLLGHAGRAAALAERVARPCRRELERAAGGAAADRYWLLATLGEAALIAGRVDDARDWYARAVVECPHAHRAIASSRRNAALVAARAGIAWEAIDAVLPLPRVVVFAGHMVDRPDRATPRFPAALEDAIRRAIADRLDAIGPAICFAPASCGADILFLEEALARGHEALVLLPCPREAFREASVDVDPEGAWGARFTAVLERVHLFPPVTASRLEPGSTYFAFANQVLLGLARHRARELGASMTGLAVWDGRSGDGPYGTAETIRLWRNAGIPYERIAIERLGRAPAGRSSRTVRRAGAGRRGGRRAAVRALLFADVKDFSKMPEEMVTPFVRHVLGLVARLARRPRTRPLGRESRGDGFYLVFETVAQAGRFALRLRDGLRGVRWARLGLPADLTMRIALHAGPVVRTRDPVTGGIAYVGTHVNRVARIEPVTPPGEVYASQEFAALAALEDVREFACHYVGQLALAKGYGIFPMYHVRAGG